jgi:hypothetical protein
VRIGLIFDQDSFLKAATSTPPSLVSILKEQDMPKLKTLPMVRVCVAYANKGVVTKIFGPTHDAPIIRPGVKAEKTGEMLLREAIPAFKLNLKEIDYLK